MEITGYNISRSFLILVLLTSACQPASKNNLTKPLENPQLFQDGGVLMLLPGVFVRTTFEELGDSVSHEIVEGPVFIFRDSSDARNIFYFNEASYLDVEEGTEDKMFAEFESVMIENSTKIGATCQLVENKLFYLSNGYKVFKMSYAITYSDNPRDSGKEYFTTYFIASETRIVKVVVHNTSDDGESTVRTMNIDRYFYVDPLPAD